MAVDFKFDFDKDAACLICGGANAFTGVAQSFAVELVKLSAGYGSFVVTSLLTITWVWQLGKGLWNEQGYDKDFLIETTMWCIAIGMLMTEPTGVINLVFWIYAAGLDLAAKAFQVTGGQNPATGMAGLLASVETALKSAFGPVVKSMLREVGLTNLTALLVLLVFCAPLYFIARSLFKNLITPGFIIFIIACGLYPILMCGIFPASRRVVGNAVRIAGAAALQTLYAAVIVAFTLAMIAALMKLGLTGQMAAFDSGFATVFFALVFIAVSIDPMMGVPPMLFDVIQLNRAGMWQIKK
jgi:hypothetical protein